MVGAVPSMRSCQKVSQSIVVSHESVEKSPGCRRSQLCIWSRRPKLSVSVLRLFFQLRNLCTFFFILIDRHCCKLLRRALLRRIDTGPGPHKNIVRQGSERRQPAPYFHEPDQSQLVLLVSRSSRHPRLPVSCENPVKASQRNLLGL